MQFNSIEFLFYFLPLFLAVYWIFPDGSRRLPLIAGSLIFYGFASGGNVWWLAVLCICTVLTFFAGRSLGKFPNKGLLALYLCLMAALLVFFKLYGGGRYLPSGMSFYLFQMAAYLIDVYCRRMKPVRRFLSYAGQTVMFPKLLSGPLVEPEKLQAQDNRTCGNALERIHDGLQLLILGLGLKVILSNRLGGLWTEAGIVGYESISVPFAWLALVAYAMQLFFDFYGYSLMAVGLGRMLGYDLPHNFLDPYASKSVSEFYRRWHATLGAWFREYLYVPLGGNRKGTLRTILNLAIVWLFTGLWHGVGGNYVLWAGFIFLFIVIERLFLRKYLEKGRVFCHVYTVFVILLSWIPFAIGDWDQMVMFCGRLFSLTGNALNTQDYLVWIGDYAGLLIAGVLFATPLPRKVWKKIRNSVWTDILLFFLFWAVVYFIATAAQDPFLYFQY